MRCSFLVLLHLCICSNYECHVRASAGLVFRAFKNGSEVAMKCPSNKITLNARDLRSFAQEVSTMAKVNHPHCVQIFCASLKPSDPFIVMEWISGGCWFDILGSDPPPNAYSRLRAARETSSAIEYLHLLGIVHGDIKSLNVLRTREGSSKVCDFGGAVQVLATAASMTSGNSKRSTTRPWCAPELLVGQSKSRESDMYAFGIFLWELLTCAVPYAGVSTDLIGDQVLRGKRPPIPSPLPEGFPEGYIQLLQQCLAENPKHRPTAKEAHSRLLQWDLSSRPSTSINLFDQSTAVPLSLLHCIMTAMQAHPGQPCAHLAPILSLMVDAATLFIRRSASLQHVVRQYAITEMEAQAVTVYTMDARHHGGLKEQSVFYVYNASLRMGDHMLVQRWQGFSLLFCSALYKMPSIEATVFRGLNLPLTQLSHLYSKGSTVWLNAVTSTTADKAKTLLNFGQGALGRPGTLLQLIAIDAKDIQAFSPYPEQELVIPPNSCHTVEVVLDSAQVKALSQFGDLPENVDLIVMRQKRISPVKITAINANGITDVPTSSFFELELKSDLTAANQVFDLTSKNDMLQDLIRLQALHAHTAQQSNGNQQQPFQVPAYPLPALTSAVFPTAGLSLEALTSVASAAAVAYYDDIEFAMDLCEEIISEDDTKPPLLDAIKQARLIFRRVLLSQQQPSIKTQIVTALNSAGHRMDPILSARAYAIINRQPAWPKHESLVRFNAPLLRQKRSWLGDKQWFPRFYVLRGQRLYHSNGKNGFPDSQAGTLAYEQSRPEVDGHCCMNLQGCKVSPCSDTSDVQPFSFEIKDRHSNSVFLAATNDASRQRCIHAIETACAGFFSQGDIALTTSVTKNLFVMRKLSAMNNVLAILGKRASKGFDTMSLINAGFNSKDLILAGCSLWEIIDAGLFSTECSRVIGSCVYATLHEHKVDGATLPEDGNLPVAIPLGWEIAPDEPEIRWKCGSHPWRSECLVLKPGNSIYTSRMPDGTQVKAGKQASSSGCLLMFKEKFASKHSTSDVLLRKSLFSMIERVITPE